MISIKKTLFLIVTSLFSVTAFSQNKFNLDFDDFDPDAEEMPKDWFK